MIRRSAQSAAVILSAVTVMTSIGLTQPVFARKTVKPPEPEPAPIVRADDPGCKGCISEATSLFARGQADQAAKFLREWSPRCPNSARLHILFSTILLSSGATEEAERESGLASSLSPSLLAAHLQHALALTAMNRKIQAVKEYERCTEIDPTCYEAWLALASVYRQLHDDDKAKDAAGKAADLDPSSKAQKMGTLLNLKNTKRFAEARTEIKRLLAAENTSPEFAEDLARESLLVGGFDEAAKAASLAISAHPKSVAPLMTSAIAHYCQNNFPACIDDTTRLSELEPANLDVLALKASALVKANRMEEAENTLANTAADKNSTMYLLSKGSVDAARNQLQSAEEALTACLEYDQGNNALQGIPHALAHIALADVYKRQGKSALAAEQTQAIARDKRFTSSGSR